MQKIEETVREDCRLTVDDMSAMFPQIFGSLLNKTITETLRYRKLCSRWGLTEQHKLNRVASEFFVRIKLDGEGFLSSIVTGEET